MVKLSFIPLLFLIGGFAIAKPDVHSDYADAFEVVENERGNYTVTGIKTNHLSDNNIRIYKFDDKPIDSIADNAFVDTTFNSIVLSKDITYISDAVFESAPNIKNIYYTGSCDEFTSLNLSFDINKVYPYSADEGFINFYCCILQLSN